MGLLLYFIGTYMEPCSASQSNVIAQEIQKGVNSLETFLVSLCCQEPIQPAIWTSTTRELRQRQEIRCIRFDKLGVHCSGEHYGFQDEDNGGKCEWLFFFANWNVYSEPPHSSPA